MVNPYQLYEFLSHALLVVSPDGRCDYLNREAKRLLPTIHDFSQLTFDEIIDHFGFSADREHLTKLIAITFHTQQRKELTLKDRNGQFATVNTIPLEGAVLVEFGVNTQLSRWRDIFKFVVEDSEDMIFYKGKDLTYEYVNKAYTDYYNLSPREILSSSDVDLVNMGVLSPILQYQCQQSDEEALKNGCFSGIEVCGDRYYQAIKRRINDGVFCISRDITEDIRLRQETERDPVTGLQNEQSLAKVIKSLSKEKEHHFIVIYLENLGQISKSKGITYSRQCIQQVSHFVREYSELLFFYVEGIGFIGLFDKMPKNPDHFYHQFMEKLHQQHVPSQLEISVMLKSTQSDPEFFQFIKKH